jgi:hypothetical protein
MCREKAGSSGQVVGPVIVKMAVWHGIRRPYFASFFASKTAAHYSSCCSQVAGGGEGARNPTDDDDDDGNGLVLVIDLLQDCITR